MTKSPTLVLLPGLDGSAVLFGPLRRALGELDVRVVEYAPQECDYAGLLARVRAVCAGLGEHVVLGWSFSGPLAIALAARPLPGLRGVILAATFARSPWPCGRALALGVHPWLMRLAPLGSWALGTASGDTGRALRRDKQLAWGNLPPATLAARVRSVLRVDVRAELRACAVPALALVSSRDLVVPGWNARAMRRELPGIAVTKLSGGHLALYTAATSAAATIGGFIGKLAR